MEPLISAAEMQADFKCTECGFCCLHGGQIEITAEEVKRIAEYLGVDREDGARLPVAERKDKPGTYRLNLVAPCFFLDKATMKCIINEVKPRSCRDYPWLLLERGGAGWFDVLMCPTASAQLDDMFNLYRRKI